MGRQRHFPKTRKGGSVNSKKQKLIIGIVAIGVMGIVLAIVIYAIGRVTRIVTSEPAPRPAAVVIDGDSRKLLALADKLILTANGLSSTQDDYGLSIANEYAPLAEYVIKCIGKSP